MGLLERFRRDEVVGTRVLVCAVGSGFDGLLKRDADAYKNHYSVTTAATFAGIDELLRAIREGQYDVVHLLCRVDSSGQIDGSGTRGTELIEDCCASGVKLLWVASENEPDAYIKGFYARGKRLNLVMTIRRNGQNFAEFLDHLLSRMLNGDAMPVAWNDLCPQVPGSAHPDAPECIFFAGRGGVRLR